MIVDLIDTIEDLEKVRENWDEVYLADRHARYFLSFRFLRDWMASFTGHWFVLAAKPTIKSRYEAFLPLRMRTSAREDGHCVSELMMAGNYGADYAGMVALSDRERTAMPAFARALKLLHWSQVAFDYVPADDRRYRHLLVSLMDSNLKFRTESRVNTRDNVDNLICPVVHLPEDWEAYLAGLSANMRQKLRRLLRAFEADPALEIVQPTAGNLVQYIEQMNRLWLGKWEERKGSERARQILATNRRMILDAFSRGDLFMPILRHEGQLVAALTTFVDPLKHAAHFFMTGRDESFDGPAPGLLLHGYSIRELMGRDIRTYDFLRGNEPYKLLFGPTPHRLQCLRVATRSGLNLGNALEPRAIPAALTLATTAHRKGRFREAAVGYGQVLAQDPNNVDALYRYGQLLRQIGRTDDARRLLVRAQALRSKPAQPEPMVDS